MHVSNLIFVLLVTSLKLSCCALVYNEDIIQNGGRLESSLNLYDKVQYNAVFSLIDPEYVSVYSADFNNEFYLYTTVIPSGYVRFMYAYNYGNFHVVAATDQPLEFNGVYFFNEGYLSFQNLDTQADFGVYLQLFDNKKDVYISGDQETTKLDISGSHNTGSICVKGATIEFRTGDEGNGCIILQDSAFISNGEMNSVVCLTEGDSTTIFLQQDAMGSMKIANFGTSHSLRLEYSGNFPYFTYDTNNDILVIEHGRRLEVDFGPGYNATGFQGEMENGFYIIRYRGIIYNQLHTPCPCACPDAPPTTAPGVLQVMATFADPFAPQVDGNSVPQEESFANFFDPTDEGENNELDKDESIDNNIAPSDEMETSQAELPYTETTMDQFKSCVSSFDQDLIQVGGRFELECPHLSLEELAQFNALFSFVNLENLSINGAVFNKEVYYYSSIVPENASLDYAYIASNFHIMTAAGVETLDIYLGSVRNEGYLTFQNLDNEGLLRINVNQLQNEREVYISGSDPERIRYESSSTRNNGVICAKGATFYNSLLGSGRGCYVLQDTVFINNGDFGTIICLSDNQEDKSVLYPEEEANGGMSVVNFGFQHSLKIKFSIDNPSFSFNEYNSLVIEIGKTLEVNLGPGYNSRGFEGVIEDDYFVIRYSGTIDDQLLSECPCICPGLPQTAASGVDAPPESEPISKESEGDTINYSELNEATSQIEKPEYAEASVQSKTSGSSQGDTPVDGNPQAEPIVAGNPRVDPPIGNSEKMTTAGAVASIASSPISQDPTIDALGGTTGEFQEKHLLKMVLIMIFAVAAM
ncbi:uncharacterized protein J8A68_003523 [[Candida] subhashii]|uniref:Hyphally-regulated cell wall protein N-terminal domain-containing protein n=1 Tax=[Candida] subhashii TaxID=561895 RepID=A0A8J5UH88_9ASCO|nr:uncharacterized protein J8A68_003523 [[Candida] subhashii]KAG7662973.1 hypothetical protein J8A68_003523 [[Candida] subhashii]